MNNVLINERCINIIKFYRLKKGITQAKMAEELDVTGKHYCHLENLKYQLTLKNLDIISKILGKDVNGTAKGTTLLTEKIANLKQNVDTTLIDDGTDAHNIRYSGGSVNNYVCLRNEKLCTDDNLYRIIGSFNNVQSFEGGNLETRVKLIRANSLGDLKWDDTNVNDWARPATLNTYLNSLSLANNNLIDQAVWHLSHYNTINLTSMDAYNIDMDSNNPVYVSKIALMYPSDYGFASKECYMDRLIYNGGNNDYDNDLCRNSNWLFVSDVYQHTLSSYFPTTSNIIRISTRGHFNINNKASGTNFTRPTFYLKTNIKIINNDNDGSLSKSYILTL